MTNKMTSMRLSIAILAAMLVLLGALPGMSVTKQQVDTSSEDQKSIAITIYNDGTGLVKDTRSINFPEGEFDLRYMDVAASMDPTSVHFVSLTDPKALGILEQNYQYDLVNTAALYAAHIDRGIKVRTSDGRIVDGTLLSYDGNLVIKTSDGIVIVTSPVEVNFAALPEGLITKPTLKWSLMNNKPGMQDTEMSYLTSGLGWSANYVAVVGQDDDKLDLSGWVTINNTSGADYKDALLKLVAGQVHKVQPAYEKMDRNMGMAMPMAAPMPPGFQEESFFEYHLYTLQRPATVLDKEQKQINLLEGNGIGAQKLLILNFSNGYGGPGETVKGTVQAKLKFKNSEKNNLGMPLPAGTIRVYKKDSSSALQFIGEDSITHTPKDEDIEIFLGDAFDIVCERAIMDRRKINDRTWEYNVKVTVRNHKTMPVTVTCWDYAGGYWEMVKSSINYVKKDASTIQFDIPVKTDGETVLTYTVRTTY